MSKFNSYEDLMTSLANQGGGDRNVAPIAEEKVEEQGQPPVEEVEDSQEVVEVKENIEADVVDEAEKTSDDTTDVVVDDWDDVESPSKDLDVSSIGKALGFDDVKSVDELSTKVKEKITSLEKSISEVSLKSELSDVPEDLREAVNLARQGEDYIGFLSASQIDYDSVPDKELVVNSIVDYFTNQDGSVREEELQDYVDSLSDVQVKIEGSRIRNLLKKDKQSKIDSIKTNAERKRVENEARLKSAIQSFNEVQVLDGVKFKITDSHKAKLQKDITDGVVLKKMFYDGNGNLDFSKVLPAYFNFLYGDKITAFAAQRVGHKVKKEILDRMGNHEVRRTGQAASPEKKSVDVLDRYISSLSSQR